MPPVLRAPPTPPRTVRALQVTTYDIRHEAMLTGTHLVHIKLKGTHIQNSPLSFEEPLIFEAEYPGDIRNAKR